MKKLGLIKWTIISVSFIFCLGTLASGAAAKVRLRVVYQPFTIHNQQVKWMQEWTKKNPDVEIEPVPLAYELYYPKVSTAIQAPKCEYDIVWHNDDWGMAWIEFMEPVDDVENFKLVPRHLWDIFWADAKHPRATAVPFIGTSAGMFYRKDLIPNPPKTWKEVEAISLKLMKEGKVKFGYLGGVKYPHAYFTLLPFMWANQGDILYPPFERRNDILAKNGWKPFVTDVTMIEMLEFWWDQIHKTKTVPADFVGFTRTAAMAIFQAGDCAMFGEDALKYGDVNDPAKSKVAGKVGLASFPYGPHGKGPLSWDVPWGWGIPKNIPEENKKAAKRVIGYMLSDEVQLDMWKTTGGIPVTTHLREKLFQTDPLFKEFALATYKAPVLVMSAHYYPAWPQVHSIWNDYCVKALMGEKKDIKKVMSQCEEELKTVFKK
jgi:ABC-type glycerol-3-phosphate transport system substrate-binding protein